MRSDAATQLGVSRFVSPEEAIESVRRDGFDWWLLREYFRFTDDWLSEGSYDRLLSASIEAIGNHEATTALIDMLDLQYAVLLEQGAIQDRMVKSRDHDVGVIFGERVMAYLQINANRRLRSSGKTKSARSALLETPPGELIHRLLGGGSDERGAGSNNEEANQG
jgi:hypothetical protein